MTALANRRDCRVRVVNDLFGTTRILHTGRSRDATIAGLVWMLNQLPPDENRAFEYALCMTAEEVIVHFHDNGYIGSLMDDTRETIHRLLFWQDEDDGTGGLQIWTA